MFTVILKWISHGIRKVCWNTFRQKVNRYSRAAAYLLSSPVGVGDPLCILTIQQGIVPQLLSSRVCNSHAAESMSQHSSPSSGTSFCNVSWTSSGWGWYRCSTYGRTLTVAYFQPSEWLRVCNKNLLWPRSTKAHIYGYKRELSFSFSFHLSLVTCFLIPSFLVIYCEAAFTTFRDKGDYKKRLYHLVTQINYFFSFFLWFRSRYVVWNGYSLLSKWLFGNPSFHPSPFLQWEL